MASLKLMLERHDDQEASAKPKTLFSSVKSKFSNQSTAYKTVGTTDYSDTKVFNLLKDFFQPDTQNTLQGTVEVILKLLPDDAPMSNEVAGVADVCLEMAEQIPYHHPSQIKLARVVEELSRSSKVTSDPGGNRPSLRFYRLKETMFDCYTGPGDENAHEWPNINAFFAHYRSSHIWPHSPVFAIWAMRDAFEVSHENDEYQFDGMKDQYVIAAAQHVLWDGQELFKHFIYGGDIDDNEIRSWEPGPVFKGEGTLSLERWRFWRDGFRAAGECDESSEECRKVATKAANLMEAIEQAMVFD